jgi:hypothetical protein
LKSIIILLLLSSVSALGEEKVNQETKVEKEYVPTAVLRNIDQKISYLAKNKTCTNKATTHDQAKLCVKALKADFATLEDFDLLKELGVKLKKQ